jgi:hypothetical protein
LFSLSTKRSDRVADPFLAAAIPLGLQRTTGEVEGLSGLYPHKTLAEPGGRNNVRATSGPLMVTAGFSLLLISGAEPGYADRRSVNALSAAVAREPARNATLDGEASMTTFDEREKSFEKKFAHDQDLRFKAESRRNKMIAEWAAAKMGVTGTAVDDYVKAVRKADLLEKGDDDVVRKITKDLTDKGLTVAEADIRNQMGEFLAKAVADLEAGR